MYHLAEIEKSMGAISVHESESRREERVSNNRYRTVISPYFNLTAGGNQNETKPVVERRKQQPVHT